MIEIRILTLFFDLEIAKFEYCQKGKKFKMAREQLLKDR